MLIASIIAEKRKKKTLNIVLSSTMECISLALLVYRPEFVFTPWVHRWEYPHMQWGIHF